MGLSAALTRLAGSLGADDCCRVPWLVTSSGPPDRILSGTGRLLAVPRAARARVPAVFSNATMSLAYGTAAVAFHAVAHSAAGLEPGSGSHALAWTGLAACCGAMAWVINNGLLLVAIRLADPGTRARVQYVFGNRQAIVADFLELTLAVTLALVVAINPVFMVLALPSIVLYRRKLLQAQLVAQPRIDSTTGLLNAGAWWG
jgi:hypothetical protein